MQPIFKSKNALFIIASIIPPLDEQHDDETERTGIEVRGSKLVVRRGRVPTEKSGREERFSTFDDKKSTNFIERIEWTFCRSTHCKNKRDVEEDEISLISSSRTVSSYAQELAMQTYNCLNIHLLSVIQSVFLYSIDAFRFQRGFGYMTWFDIFCLWRYSLTSHFWKSHVQHRRSEGAGGKLLPGAELQGGTRGHQKLLESYIFPEHFFSNNFFSTYWSVA